MLVTAVLAAPPWTRWYVPPSGGGGPTLLIHDDFTGTAGTTMAGRTPDTVNTPGNTWTVANGTWTVDGSGNAEGNGAGSAPWNAVWIDSGVADCTVITVGTMGASASTMTGGLFVRVVDLANTWIVTMTKSDPELRIVERNGGTETTQASDGTVTINTGDQLALWVTLSGTSITATMTNLTTGLGATTSYSSTFNQTATIHGLRSRGTAYFARYGEYKVQTP